MDRSGIRESAGAATEQAAEKKCTRQAALACRDSLSLEERQDFSAMIAKRLTALPCYRQAKAVLAYISFRSEVDTLPVLERAFADGKAVFAPKVLGQEMAFFQIMGREDLEKGYQGILEPRGGILYTDWVGRQKKGADNTTTLICLPGTAFDRKCHRIGYGGGFYDRYLGGLMKDPETEVPRIAAVALAFTCQVFAEIPWEVHDICPETIITETEIISRP